MKPSVGRIVHYVSYGTPGGEYGRACRAAIITEVTVPQQPGSVDEVGLFVANPTGLFLNQAVPFEAGTPLKPGESRRDLCGEADYPGGTWHWPARVDG